MAVKLTNQARAALVEAWRVSGLSQAAFARLHHIHFTTLNGWIHNPKFRSSIAPPGPEPAPAPASASACTLPPAPPASPSLLAAPLVAPARTLVAPIRVLAPPKVQALALALPPAPSAPAIAAAPPLHRLVATGKANIATTAPLALAPAPAPAPAPIPIPAMHLHIGTHAKLSLPPPAQCCPLWLSALLKGLT